MSKRLGIVAGVLVATLAFVLLAYFQPWGKREVETRTVRLNTPVTAVDFAPFYIAKQKGWFEESLSGSRAKPEFQPPLQTFPAIHEALATDRVDLVMGADTLPIFARASGTDVKIVWLS